VTQTKRGSGTTQSTRLSELAASLAARPYAQRGVSPSNQTIRVVIADDHNIVREGLRVLLRSTSDISVVAEPETGASALALARTLVPDVLVLDLDMPGGDGASTLRSLQEAQPSIRVLILTMHAEHD